jgi:hypothetical protein
MLKLLLTRKSLEFIGMYCPMAVLALAASLTRRAWLWRAFPLVSIPLTHKMGPEMKVSEEKHPAQPEIKNRLVFLPNKKTYYARMQRFGACL